MVSLISFVIKNRSLVLAGLVVLACGGFWIHGFFEGRKQARIQVIEKVVEENAKAIRETQEVARDVQAYSDHDVDVELCRLGIVRGNDGCDRLSGMD